MKREKCMIPPGTVERGRRTAKRREEEEEEEEVQPHLDQINQHFKELSHYGLTGLDSSRISAASSSFWQIIFLQPVLSTSANQNRFKLRIRPIYIQALYLQTHSDTGS